MHPELSEFFINNTWMPISHWLDKYENDYCLVPCTCRQSRKIRGEGSLEDVNWYIMVGPFVEYAIETKKAVRRLTKEEVLEICQKAEDAGYVHQVSNQDGADKIFALCNCNIESCYALRTSQYFNTPNMSASPYRARVDKEKCVACGQCAEVCPAALRLSMSISVLAVAFVLHDASLMQFPLTAFIRKTVI